VSYWDRLANRQLREILPTASVDGEHGEKTMARSLIRASDTLIIVASHLSSLNRQIAVIKIAVIVIALAAVYVAVKTR